MNISGKTIKLLVKDGYVTVLLNNESVTMTIGEWSKLISNPDKL